MRSFLVATDGSEPADRALDVAAAMAQAAGGSIKLMTVWIALPEQQQQQFRRAEGELADPSEAFGEQILARARYHLQQAGIEPSASLLRWGDPAESVIAVIAEEEVDAVVVGRRLLRTPMGFMIAPLREGKIVPPDEFSAWPEPERKAAQETIENLQHELAQIVRNVPVWEKEHRDEVQKLDRQTTLVAIDLGINAAKGSFTDLPRVLEYLDAVRVDLIDNSARQ
ncbi:universal stress protein [Bradyrhizobium sp.]|uniref:universal stress protein n=1 Tax=Bradyrhizobium sp. TaxID=376 RepID=UPI0025B9C7F5|nr:universal stress protein [Bradyrhizobium sp.]